MIIVICHNGVTKITEDLLSLLGLVEPSVLLFCSLSMMVYITF